MSTNLAIKLPKDLTQINCNDFGELIWWCNHLGISPEKLLQTIAAIGSSAIAVRKYLHK
jgi:hypothetical protein